MTRTVLRELVPVPGEHVDPDLPVARSAVRVREIASAPTTTGTGASDED